MISSTIGPRDLIENILKHEHQHLRFYNSLRELEVYVTSQETCDSLLNYKIQQIRDTSMLLEEMEIAV